MARRSTSVTRPALKGRDRSAQETVIMLTLFGSALLVATLFLISYLKEEAADQTNDVTEVQRYSLATIAIVAITASVHYFGSIGSASMRLLVLGLGITGIVLSCLGVRYTMRLAEDDPSGGYSDEYKAMRWVTLGGFLSTLLFSTVVSVRYLSSYRMPI